MYVNTEENEMKSIYNTPEIKIENLTKSDVLCASNEVEPTINGLYNIEGSANGWTIEEFL